jgi:hypothetical protein
MILIHSKDGNVEKFNVDNSFDIALFDNRSIQKNISRISILGERGCRVDLPSLKCKYSRFWLEKISKNNKISGVKVNLYIKGKLIKATHYFSDDRIVIDYMWNYNG